MQRAHSGAPWESQVGYCRAIRVRTRMFVADISRWAEYDEVDAIVP